MGTIYKSRWNPFADVPGGMDELSLEIIFLTARYVAQLGSPFLTQLRSLEKGNAQYGFLFPDHPFHGRFNALVDCYRACLQPPDELLAELAAAVADPRGTLSRLREAAFSEGASDGQVLSAAGEAEYLGINWQDFVVVGSIRISEGSGEEDGSDDAELDMEMSDDGDDDESDSDNDLEATGGQKTKKTKKKEKGGDLADDDDVAVDDDASQTYSQSFLGSVPVVKSYQPAHEKKRASSSSGGDGMAATVQCHICGQSVGVDELEEHVRIELSDPEARAKAAAQEQARIPSGHVADDGAVLDSLMKLRRKEESSRQGVPQELAGALTTASLPSSAYAQGSFADRRMRSAALEAEARRNAVTGQTRLQQQLLVHSQAPQPSPASATAPELPPSIKRQRTSEFPAEPPVEPPVKLPLELPAASAPLAIKVPAQFEGHPGVVEAVLEVESKPTMSVRELKQVVSARLQIPPNKFKLKASIGILKDDTVLGNIDIANGHLELTMRERGGRRR